MFSEGLVYVSELCAIVLEPDEEVLVQIGYHLDALVKVNSEKVAIEVGGPSHFMKRS